MQSSTIDFQPTCTAYFASDGNGQWTDLEHPHFYYDPGFKQFCVGKLAELEALKEGWDGDGAPPINRDVLAAVRRFVDALPNNVAIRPMVVPLSSGNVQLEWHQGRQVLELEFESPDTVHYLKWDPDNQVEDEDVIAASNTGDLVGLIRWFMKEFFNA